MGKKQGSGNKRVITSYEEKYEIMYRYLVENNAFETGIRARTEFEGHPIGQWQANMRAKYYSGELEISVALEKKFLELGIIRTEKQRNAADKLTWEEKYTIMEEYLRSGQPLEHNTIYEGYKIGQWQTVARHLFYTDSLTTVSPELRKKLFEAGILKKQKGTQIKRGSAKISYDKKFEIMYQYLESNDFEEEIHQKTTFKGHRIGVWQDNLRQTYRKGRDLLIGPELMEKFFAYGILREEDREKRKFRVNGNETKTGVSSEHDNEIDQMVKTLLRKQKERKALDAEIAELQKRIRKKTGREI